MESFDIPDAWWGAGLWWGREPRSIIDLMAEGTLDARLAGLLWAAVHQHVSLVVVAGHTPGVGKTTLLTALMAFLAPGITPVFTAGQGETFDFVGQTKPSRTRIMVNELSDHLRVYLWGPEAARAFALAGQGYALGVTMHAESLEELVGQVEPPPVGVPRRIFAERLPLVVLLAMGHRERRMIRRVTSVLLLRADGAGEPEVQADALSMWDAATDTFQFVEAEEAWARLAARMRLAPGRLRQEWEARTAFLESLVQADVRDYDLVRAAILRYDHHKATDTA